jgi:phosphoribosyl-ATP pyrophosphohydrolase
MTNEDTLIALNKELAKYRAAGDTDSYIIAQAKKESILAKMGEEAEEEYINLYRFFGDKS